MDPAGTKLSSQIERLATRTSLGSKKSRKGVSNVTRPRILFFTLGKAWGQPV